MNQLLNVGNSIESGEQLQINESEQPKSDDGSPDVTKDVVPEGQPIELEMESGRGENQLEEQPEPDNKSEVGVSGQGKNDMSRQYVTPYSLRPRLQPPARFT